jgi:hypothetical protein
MMDKLKYINLMNSSKLWVPRNAKALKCLAAAGEEIPFHRSNLVVVPYILPYILVEIL